MQFYDQLLAFSYLLACMTAQSQCVHHSLSRSSSVLKTESVSVFRTELLIEDGDFEEHPYCAAAVRVWCW